MTSDVTDHDSIVAAAIASAGVLINKAGIMLLGPSGSDQRADYRQMIEVNLLGAIISTEVFLDQLTGGGGNTWLGQLANVPAADLAKRPGTGPTASRLPQEALEQHGMSLGLDEFAPRFGST